MASLFLDHFHALPDSCINILFTQAMDAGSEGLAITVQVTTPTFRDELCLRIMKEIEGLKAA